MKYQYQTRPHPHGDCLRACIATILEIPIGSVPDFSIDMPADALQAVEQPAPPALPFPRDELRGHLAAMLGAVTADDELAFWQKFDALNAYTSRYYAPPTPPPTAPDAPPDYPKWYLTMQEYLRPFGYIIVEVLIDGSPWVPLPGDVVAIFKGEHVSGNCKHAIVGRCVDGKFYPLFDPLGENVEGSTLKRIDSVSFFVPLDPMAFMRMGQALEEIKLTARGIPGRILGDAIEECCDKGLGLVRPDAPRIYSPGGQLVGTKEKPAQGIIVPGDFQK